MLVKNWKEVWAVLATFLVASACYVSKAPPLVSVASLVGICYVVLVAYGHWSANVFGAILGGLFGALSYQAGFFGNAAINFFFTVPASLWGVWYWMKHSGERPRTLTSFQKWNVAGILVIMSAISMYLCKVNDSNMWYLDGFTAVLPILATVMLVRRYREQWYLWIPYNALEVFMWFVVANATPEMYAVLVMRVVFLLNSFIGCILWHKN